MIKQVGELICSQENQPGTSKSTRKVTEQLHIHRSSIQRTVKRDLQLSAFRRVPAQIISEFVKQKRHDRCKKLVCCLPVKFAEKVFFTDEKNFCLKPPVNHQNDRVWSAGKKRDVDKSRNLPSTSRSLLVCAMAEKEDCKSIPDKAKVNGKLNYEILLPRLVEDCKLLLPSCFIFQQDGGSTCSHGKAASKLDCHQLQ